MFSYETNAGWLRDGWIADLAKARGISIEEATRIIDASLASTCPASACSTAAALAASEARVRELESVLREIAGMIMDCAGVPTEPDSLPQMIKHLARAALSEAPRHGE